MSSINKRWGKPTHHKTFPTGRANGFFFKFSYLQNNCYQTLQFNGELWGELCHIFFTRHSEFIVTPWRRNFINCFDFSPRLLPIDTVFSWAIKLYPITGKIPNPWHNPSFRVFWLTQFASLYCNYVVFIIGDLLQPVFGVFCILDQDKPRLESLSIAVIP